MMPTCVILKEFEWHFMTGDRQLNKIQEQINLNIFIYLTYSFIKIILWLSAQPLSELLFPWAFEE